MQPEKSSYQRAKDNSLKIHRRFMHFLYVLAFYLLFEWIIVSGVLGLLLSENQQGEVKTW